MGLLSSIGNAFNSLTGSNSAAGLSYKYSSALASQNAEYQREFAKNAHQWEVEDLKKAGLNPVLSAGGSGASASGGGGGTVGVSAGAGGFSEIMNSAKGLMSLASELENIGADTEQKRTTTSVIKGKYPHEIDNINSQTAINNANIKKIGSEVMLNSAKTLEAKANAQFQKERARGKTIAGQGGASIKGVSGGFTYTY